MQSCAPRPAPGRVLVIEDDPEAALFAVYALEKGGQFKVTHTADPAVALALAVTESWDLAVTDLDLPVISGARLIAALRAVAPRLPVILVTAHRFEPMPPAGCQPDDMLLKPFSAASLLAAAVAVCPSRGS